MNDYHRTTDHQRKILHQDRFRQRLYNSEAIDPSEFGRTYTETGQKAATDYLDHLISIGVDVTDFENEVISE